MHIPYFVSGTNVNDVKLVILRIHHQTGSHTQYKHIQYNPIRVRFPIADKSLADRRHIVSLTPLSNTRGAAVLGDVYYCVNCQS